MKKVLFILLTVLLIGTLVACGTQTGDTGEQTSIPCSDHSEMALTGG